MIEEFFKWAFGAGIAQGLFLIAALSSVRVRDRPTKWLLIAIIAIYTVLLAEEFLELLDLKLNLALGIFLFSAQIPLFHLLVSSVASHNYRFNRGHLLHCIPFGMFFSLYVVIRIVFWGEHFSANNPAITPIATAWAVGKILLVAGYLITILHRLATAKPRTQARRTSLRWLFWGLIALCTLMAIDGLAFAMLLSSMEGALDSDLVSGLIMAIAVYGLGYLALTRRELLSSERVRASFDKSEIRQRLDGARKTLVASGLHQDARPTYDSLARAMALPVDAVRPAIDQTYPGGLQDLVNEVRLDTFCELLRSDPGRQHSILELALEAGFQSKPSFYRLFRARFGSTPNAYREQLPDRHV